MILLVIVGIYAIVAKRIRITHSFQLIGMGARNFGLTLIVGAIPATFVLNLAIRLWVPRGILSDRLVVSIINVGFLAVVMFGAAWYFRDHKHEKPPATSTVISNEPEQ